MFSWVKCMLWRVSAQVIPVCMCEAAALHRVVSVFFSAVPPGSWRGCHIVYRASCCYNMFAHMHLKGVAIKCHRPAVILDALLVGAVQRELQSGCVRLIRNSRFRDCTRSPWGQGILLFQIHLNHPDGSRWFGDYQLNPQPPLALQILEFLISFSFLSSHVVCFGLQQ